MAVKGITIFSGLLLCMALTGLAQSVHHSHHKESTWQQAVDRIIDRYDYHTEHDLAPYFAEADMLFPPKKLALLIFKEEKVMRLWASDGKRWAYITQFNILAASGTVGPKLYRGDRQVPEGIYRITMLNPYSHYHLSLKINYPNHFDKIHAQMDHRSNLGGDIFIHGGQLSLGCVAIGDHAIEDLFVLVAEVGVNNVSVIITPNDLRTSPAHVAWRHPRWIKALNTKIRASLCKFKHKTV